MVGLSVGGDGETLGHSIIITNIIYITLTLYSVIDHRHTVLTYPHPIYTPKIVTVKNLTNITQ